MTTPWHRVRPTGAVDVATDDDDFVTADRWPSEVFRPHYQDAEFNWIVPLRAGRVVVSIDGEEFAIVGEATIARGLALAWGEQRFARRRRNPFDDALGLFVAGWSWRHYNAPPAEIDLALTLREKLGSDGATIAVFFERHLADQPFPWPALAERLGTSTRTLQRRFIAALGHAPSTTLHRLRLERARDLLRDPARPIVGRIAGPGVHRANP